MSKYDHSNSDRIKILTDININGTNLKDRSIINNSTFIIDENKNETKILIKENIYKNKIDTSLFIKANEIEDLKKKQDVSNEKEIVSMKDIEKTIIIKRNNPFKIRLRDLINYAFRCKRLNKQLDINDVANQKFNQSIDIINYMTKMQEIDILKLLILDEDMVEIMGFLSKPQISSTQINEKLKIFDIFYDCNSDIPSVKDNMSNIKRLFDKIMKKANPDVFSKRLMKLFDHEIKNLKQ